MKPQVDMFSFIFWKKLKTPNTRRFEINWPLDFNLVCRILRNSNWISYGEINSSNSCNKRVKPIDFLTNG